jgi:2-polyprenyl-3-methyl-5-hydroxy-6-metoxy-1,4-benzoquinol methylase
MAQAAYDQPVLDRKKTTDGVTAGCSLCGSDRAAPMFEKAGHQYWRCASCSLVFARGLTNANFQESIADYEPAYRQYLNGGPVDASNLDDVIAWIESHVSLRTAAVRLLDVGAGSGKLVRRLRQLRPCAVSGIEPSGALFHTYDLGSLGIEATTLPEMAATQPAAYDVVTVFDVIEHVPEAAEFVRALALVTKPGGFVFLSTPDGGGLLARLLGRRWHHYNAYHLSLYGRRAVAEAARRSGFRVVASEHRSRRMPLDYLWRYAMDFLFARRAHAGGHHPSRFAIPVNLGDTLYVVWQRT